MRIEFVQRPTPWTKPLLGRNPPSLMSHVGRLGTQLRASASYQKNPATFLHQTSVHPVSKTHWATRRRQPSVFTESCCATSQVMPMLFKSRCIVSILIFLGLPWLSLSTAYSPVYSLS